MYSKSSTLTSFYLNYVGCKVDGLTSMFNLGNCFTLTMWDVKVTMEHFLDLGEDAFYLNYVGCKVDILADSTCCKIVLP